MATLELHWKTHIDVYERDAQRGAVLSVQDECITFSYERPMSDDGNETPIPFIVTRRRHPQLRAGTSPIEGFRALAEDGLEAVKLNGSVLWSLATDMAIEAELGSLDID